MVRYCCRGLWNGKPRRGAKGGSSRRMVMGNHGDPWFALDKAEHFVACFAITVAAATVLGFVRKELRGWLRLALGSLLGLTAGALKEVGDATHLLPSDGASIKDGVADVLGVSCAAIVLYYYFYAHNKHKDKSRENLGGGTRSSNTWEDFQLSTISEDV